MTATSPTSPAAGEDATRDDTQQRDQQDRQQDRQHDQRQQDAEEREAYDYWGYLFKADRTGTDRLKALLAGLKTAIIRKYEPSDSIDLTPTQLAHFYREVHGDYDRLFLNTPHESIAFIYKSLGCLHSLQPQSYAHSKAFSDPTVPALKTEGWVMWQTVQLLLGPDEHAGFLTEAIQKFDVRDPATGEAFPKILPRRCFPSEPDKHMVAWYEGVSDRLRREAEEQVRQKEREAEEAKVRRIRAKAHEDIDDDDGSVDSRAPALAYFRNPLYRHLDDGRPTIVQRPSKRPPVSPRPPTFVDKGKEAAATFGHVVRNLGSPHLWDGRGSRSASHDRDRDRRRRSVPGHTHSSTDQDAPPSTSPHHSRRHHSRSSQRLASGPSPRDENPSSYSSQASGQLKHSRRESHENSLRRPRSHEPTPSQKEFGDYFEGYDRPDPNRRRSSAHDSATSPTSGADGDSGEYSANAGSGFGGSFEPSASPLFATQVSRRSQPPPQRRGPGLGPSNDYNSTPRKSTPLRRPHSRPQSPSPERYDRGADGRRRSKHRDSDGRPRSRYDSPAGVDDDNGKRRPRSRTNPGQSRSERDPPRTSHSSHRNRRRDDPDANHSAPDDRDRDRDRERNGDRDRLPPRTKQARFEQDPVPAVAGVDGRRYPTDVPWR